jgi:poly(A) polymerase
MTIQELPEHGPEGESREIHATPGSEARQAAERVAQKLRQRGYQAYFVGGCVRDILRGVAPKDYDVATDARPEEVVDLFPGSLLVGAQFGVVGVLAGDHRVEVATFRSDGLYSDGRRPDEVSFSREPRQDALRRDFTVNGMLMDPATSEVLDFVEGKRDLERRVIRAIGDPGTRFEEDRLRMLRAVRFAASFAYEIDPETFAAIRRLSPKLSAVSAERVRDELLRILTSGHARRGFELLDAGGLLAVLLPEISAMKGVEQPPEYHPEGDVWTHTMMMLESLAADCSPTLALGVLLHDVGKPPTFRVAPDRIRFDNHVTVGMRMAEEICRRLRLSQDQTSQVSALVENHLRFRDAPQMRQSTLKRFLRLEKFEEHLELHRLDCLSSHRHLENYEFVRAKLRDLPPEAIRPRPLVNGDDLIRMGYRPGPRFKEILQAVEEAQLEGRISSQDEAIQFVKERFPA